MSSVLDPEAAGDAVDAEEKDATVDASPAQEGAAEAADKPKAPETAQAPAEKKEEPPKPKAPEKYSLKAPEGTQLDPALLSKVEAMFRKADLSQEDASEIFGFGIEMQDRVKQLYAKALDERAETWRKETEADPEIGGEKIKATVKAIRTYLADEKVLGHDGAKQLIEVLSDTGLANHRGLLKALAVAAKISAEDASVGGHGTPEKLQTAKSLYPNSVLE